MYTWFVTGTLFSTILLFGNKYLFFTIHKKAAAVSLFVSVATYALLFLPSEIDSCGVTAMSHRSEAFLLLIVSEFIHIAVGTHIDTIVPILINLHIAAFFSTRLQSRCNIVQFAAALCVTLTAVAQYAYRTRSARSAPKEPQFIKQPRELTQAAPQPQQNNTASQNFNVVPPRINISPATTTL
jgi:hypothetical protein